MNNQLILGIDFGTTTSCVSYFDKEKHDFIVIRNKNGNYTTPSSIYFDPDSDDILFGDETFYTTKVENIFINIKRLIGKDLNNLDKNTHDFFSKNIIENGCFIYYKKGERIKISLDEIIVYYLNYLKKYALESLNYNVEQNINVVITVPAYYNESQRTIIKTCFSKCNMNVIRILNEPTAAALYHSYLSSKEEKDQEKDQEKDYNMLVFDCGGGTTDISIVHADNEEKMYDVIEVVGDNYLGGVDVTNLLVEYFYEKLNKMTSKDKLINICERLKCELTFNNSSILYIESCDFKYTVSRYLFNEICKPFYDKIELLIEKLEYNKKDISKIILVGGCSRIPRLQEILCKKFSNAQICLNIDRDKIVSLGACLQGALLYNLMKKDCHFRESLLIDITHLSLGVETDGGLMSPIISKNSIIPVSRTVEFTNSENDSSIDINVYQGERRLVKDNFLICKFTLENVPKMEKNLLIIKVTFSINSDGILTVEAKLKNDKDKSITIVKNIKSDITLEHKREIEIDEIIKNAEENKLIDSEIN